MHFLTVLDGPPGGWHYRQAQSGLFMTAITFGSLLGKIYQHRKNMNYPLVSEGYASLSAEIQDALCQAMLPEDRPGRCLEGMYVKPGSNGCRHC
jgi:hypothetical protein